MKDQNRTSMILAEKQKQPKSYPVVLPEGSYESEMLGLSSRLFSEYSNGAFNQTSAQLDYPHLLTAQRQAIAGYIGQVHGNHRLQKMLVDVQTRTIQRELQRNPDDGGGFQLTPPQLTMPRPEAPSLGVGRLELNLSPFQTLNVEDTFSPSRLFQPSSELVRQLVDNWLMQYRLMHPGPAFPENAWQQIWSAWRRLSDEWLARGADAPLNAQLAQDLLRDQAAQSVLNQQAGGGEASLSDIAGRVWPAFQQALEATQFYPTIRRNAEGLIQQHWPVLIPILATALGTSLGMGLQGNDWRAMQQLSSYLPMLNQEISLGSNWGLTLGFAESPPIQGSGEQGVVLGVNPSIGFTYRSENIQFSIGGSVNLRFETGQESTRGFRVNASPGGQAVLRF